MITEISDENAKKNLVEYRSRKKKADSAYADFKLSMTRLEYSAVNAEQTINNAIEGIAEVESGKSMNDFESLVEKL